jgi:AMIN domain
MHSFPRDLASRLFAAALCACLAIPSVAQISVRSVKVLGSKDTVEIEVEASERIVPETQVLTGPDRLVIDFPNAIPGNQVRNQSVDRGEVKDVRVGLFQSKPPVTRVVLDLKTARSYQIFPYGRTVMIKVMGDAGATNASGSYQGSGSQSGGPGLVATNYTTRREPITVEAQQTPLRVSYRDGLLGIHANKATLSEVLFAVQQQTGAEISIPAGAEQEKVVAEIEPAPASEVLARLLNGSKFNFLIMSAGDDPRALGRVILSYRTEGGENMPSPAVVQAGDDPPAEDAPAPERSQRTNVANTVVPLSERPEADSDSPDAQNK